MGKMIIQPGSLSGEIFNGAVAWTGLGQMCHLTIGLMTNSLLLCPEAPQKKIFEVQVIKSTELKTHFWRFKENKIVMLRE